MPELPAGKPSMHLVVDVWFASYISATEKLRGRPADSSRRDLKIDDVKNHINAMGDIIKRLRDFREHALSGMVRETG